jgi:zinc transport system substrate-binding protein
MNDKKESELTKPMVAVSTFSIYDITKHIAGDKVKIINILPFGVDPHSFEPTPKLMADIEKSSLVFYSGAGLEPWVGAIEFKCKAVDVSKYVQLREFDEDEHKSHEHHDEHCSHSKFDPHYWLDFSNMQRAAILITKELIKISPENEQFFIKNRDKYIDMLKKLDKDYAQALSSCTLDTVVVNHNAVGYLASKYGFHVESLSGLSPESQPSAKDIKRIFKDIQKETISTIFFENFVNNRVIKSIAKDANISVDVLQPLGNITADEAKKNLTYEDIMYINLKKLSKALMCN